MEAIKYKGWLIEPCDWSAYIPSKACPKFQITFVADNEIPLLHADSIEEAKEIIDLEIE